MDFTTEDNRPTLPPRRKHRRTRQRPEPPVPPKPEPDEFAGLTAENCAADCCAERCVITLKPLCGHPRKGGLQPPDMVIPATLERYNRAVKVLAHNEIEREER